MGTRFRIRPKMGWLGRLRVTGASMTNDPQQNNSSVLLTLPGRSKTEMDSGSTNSGFILQSSSNHNFCNSWFIGTSSYPVCWSCKFRLIRSKLIDKGLIPTTVKCLIAVQCGIIV